MNIYKIYFTYLTDAISAFKKDFNYTFDIETGYLDNLR